MASEGSAGGRDPGTPGGGGERGERKCGGKVISASSCVLCRHLALCVTRGVSVVVVQVTLPLLSSLAHIFVH